jgi:hypothetical protein
LLKRFFSQHLVSLEDKPAKATKKAITTAEALSLLSKFKSIILAMIVGIIIAVFSYQVPTRTAIIFAVNVGFFVSAYIGLVTFVKIAFINSIYTTTDVKDSQQIVVKLERFNLIQSVVQAMAYALIIALLFLLAQLEYLNLEFESPGALLMFVVIVLLLVEFGRLLVRIIRYRAIIRVPSENFWENYAYNGLTNEALTTWREWGRQLIRPLGKYSRLPKYELLDDGVIIHLIHHKHILKNHKFYVSFDELDEIRQFSYSVEAEAFFKYTVGLDLRLAVRQMQSFRQSMKGKIPRPTLYCSQISDYGRVVSLRGPELFYVLTFDTNDASDLIEAFRKFKAT